MARSLCVRVTCLHYMDDFWMVAFGTFLLEFELHQIKVSRVLKFLRTHDLLLLSLLCTFFDWRVGQRSRRDEADLRVPRHLLVSSLGCKF